MKYLFIAETIIVFLSQLLFLSLLTLQILLDLGQCPEPFLLELLQFLDPLPDLPLLDDSLHKFFMIIRSVEPSENFQHVVNFLFFFGSGPVQSNLFLQVKQSTTDHKLFPSNTLVELLVVDIDQSKLHGLLVLCVFISELHLSQ